MNKDQRVSRWSWSFAPPWDSESFRSVTPKQCWSRERPAEGTVQMWWPRSCRAYSHPPTPYSTTPRPAAHRDLAMPRAGAESEARDGEMSFWTQLVSFSWDKVTQIIFFGKPWRMRFASCKSLTVVFLLWLKMSFSYSRCQEAGGKCEHGQSQISY